jgi:hypothetical protein
LYFTRFSGAAARVTCHLGQLVLEFEQ